MHNINPSIFRSYDIRGIYPTDVNKEVAQQIGRALGYMIQQQSGKRILVGRDMRLASPELSEGLVEGLRMQGVDVDDIGLCTVDMVYFGVAHYGYDGGVMVTASHNPKEYGGFKMTLKNLQWVRGVDVQEVLEKNSFADVSETAGSYQEKEIWDDYVAHVLSFIEPEKIVPQKIVIDAGNGMAGLAVPKILDSLPIEIIPLSFELDGNFPDRESNPLLPTAHTQAAALVKEHDADCGVLFDGDTDRLIFIDEHGGVVQADTTLIILAEYLLGRQPGKAVAYNAICSRAVPEFVEKFGGRPIKTQVGFINVSNGLKKHDGVVGGEVSAHYAFNDNYYADSGMIALVIVLQILSQSDQPLSQLAQKFRPYFRANEVNLEIEDKARVISAIKEHYKETADIDELDGVTCYFDNWWVNVRPSNTEPLLRITIEAANEQAAESRIKEVVDFIERLKM